MKILDGWCFDSSFISPGRRLLQRIYTGSHISIGLLSVSRGLSRFFGLGRVLISLVQMQQGCHFPQVMWTLLSAFPLLGTWYEYICMILYCNMWGTVIPQVKEFMQIYIQEPIKEAGILEGRNGIKETCLQVHLPSILFFEAFSSCFPDCIWAEKQNKYYLRHTSLYSFIDVTNIPPHNSGFVQAYRIISL